MFPVEAVNAFSMHTWEEKPTHKAKAEQKHEKREQAA